MVFVSLFEPWLNDFTIVEIPAVSAGFQTLFLETADLNPALGFINVPLPHIISELASLASSLIESLACTAVSPAAADFTY
jgi:hypothetical protein